MKISPNENVGFSRGKNGDDTEDSNLFHRLIGKFTEKTSALDDLNQSKVIKSNGNNYLGKKHILTDTLDYISVKTPLHRKFLDLAIERVFVEDSEVSAGGSTSNAIGLIWANPRKNSQRMM